MSGVAPGRQRLLCPLVEVGLAAAHWAVVAAVACVTAIVAGTEFVVVASEVGSCWCFFPLSLFFLT